MTPSNPDNSKPLIYRIADAIGVFHLVAPVDHNHPMSEVAGLAAALAAKANAASVETALAGKMDNKTIDSAPTANSNNLVTSGGVKAALDGKQNELTFDSTPTANSTNPVTSGGVKAALDNKSSIGNAYMDSKVEVEVKHIGDDEYDQATVIGGNRIFLGVGTDAEDGEVIINANNITNLQRALLNPDTIPTANSNNLVTSGGVKAALDGKPSVYDTEVVFMAAEETPFIYLPEYFTHCEKQKTFIMDYQGASTPFADIFHAQNTDIIRILSHDDEIINIAECFLSFRVIRQANGIAQGSDAYYVIFDGKNEY